MTTIPQAASVLLARGPGSPEVFLVRRAENLRFLGGFHAFPGGRVDPHDDAPHIAAVRELFEETGVLLARRADGSFPVPDGEWDRDRTELLADRLSFRDLLARRALTVRPEDLTFVGVLVTPPFSAIRFDTSFFTAVLPSGQAAAVWPGELTAGEWLSADAALRAWDRGENLLSPPTVALLETLRGLPIAELSHRIPPLLEAHGRGLAPIFFSPSVQVMPLFSRGLPPSTHTNVCLIGDDPAYLLDPGPSDPEEQERLFALADARLRAGRRLAGVVLTHHHPDHVGAAVACARRYGAPILAHPWTARALTGKVPVDRELNDGDVLDLGRAPHGGPWRLEAVYTPGHAPGHLAFYEPTYRLLFAGDMASTMTSIVIAPPEGDLTLYLDSVRRLRALPARLLLPAHGSISARPGFVLDECLEHRRKRERQLLDALAAGPRRAADLADELYRGLSADLMRLAELQTLAGLLKLQHEGKAVATEGEDDPLWRLSSGGSSEAEA